MAAINKAYNAGYIQDGTMEHTMDVYWPQLHSLYPAVIYIHGGYWQAKNSKVVGKATCERIASNYWVACTMNYRLTYPEALDDIASAIAFVNSFGCANGKIVLIGESSGAHIAALAAATMPSVSAQILVSGIYNLSLAQHPFIIDGITSFLKGEQQGSSKWEEASPSTYFASWPPTLLASAQNDLLMPIDDSDLTSDQVTCQYYRDGQADHTFQNRRLSLFDIQDVYLAQLKREW